MVGMEGLIYLELIVADERGGEIGCRRVDRRLCWLNGIRPIVNRNWRIATLRRRCGVDGLTMAVGRLSAV